MKMKWTIKLFFIYKYTVYIQTFAALPLLNND